jgi:transcriptional regulator with XRE-family HTH domain
MSNTKRNIFVTDKGLKILGEFVRSYRQSLPINLKDLKYKIIIDTGYTECSVSTLSKFEIGQMRLNPDLLSAISIAMPIPHPSEKRTYSDWELQEIARENLDPKTGLQPIHTE